MRDFLNNLLKGDRTIWIIFFVLCIYSVIEGYSASSILVARGSSVTGEFISRGLYLLLGFACIIGILRLNYKHIRMLGYTLWVVSLAMLVICTARGVTANGAARWFTVFGFSIQPSELAKLSMVVITADWIFRCKNNPEFEQKRFWIYLLMLYSVEFLILIQNFSTSALLFATCFLVMACCGISWRKLFRMCAYPLALVAVVLGLAFAIPESHFQDHDLSRVESTFYSVFKRAYTWTARIDRQNNEENQFTLADENAQIGYSQAAIARGGILPHPGGSIVRDYLSEAYSDFIFAIILEELGLIVGGLFVIMLYVALLVRVGKVVRHATNIYPTALALGAALIMVLQAFIHMMVCVKLIPVTGQPLPIISRGGSACLMCCCCFGLILNVTHYAFANKEATTDLQAPSAPDDEIIVVENDEEKINNDI